MDRIIHVQCVCLDSKLCFNTYPNSAKGPSLEILFPFIYLDMVSPVPDQFNFPAEEEKILELWKKLDAFQTSLKLSKDRPRYTFYDGPPFATGLPHYGHILAGTIKVQVHVHMCRIVVCCNCTHTHTHNVMFTVYM